MTITTSLGTAASGGSGPRSTLLLPPKKRKITAYKSICLPGGCAGGDLGATNQEKAANFGHPCDPRQEPEVAVEALARPLPPGVQEPAKPKRSGDAGSKIIWVFKKQCSADPAAFDRGNAIAEANLAAAAAAPSSIVQEPAGNRYVFDCVWKKGHRSRRGMARVAVDETKQEKLVPCEFAAPSHRLDGLHQGSEVIILDLALPLRSVQKPVKHDHHQNGEEACWLIKKSCLATAAISEGSNGAVDLMNTAGLSTPYPGIREPVNRSLPVQEAKAAGRRCRKPAKHSDCKTKKQPLMSLSSRLHCLGVTNVTPLLAKTLTATDCRLDQSRLQLQPTLVMDSPLVSMLTPYEIRAVHRESEDNLDGLPLEALDRHGHSYDMTFKYLESVNAYRLIHEWARFVAQNGVRDGDLVELGAFRFEGQLVLTLLHHAKEDQTPEEMVEAEGEEEWTPEEMEAAQGAEENRTPKEMEAAEGEEEWAPEEMEAMEGLLELSDLKDRTKS